MLYKMRYHIPFCCNQHKIKVGVDPHQPLGAVDYSIENNRDRAIKEAQKVCQQVKANVYVNWDDLNTGFLIAYPDLRVVKR
jgi:hypothetical protein